MVFTVEPGIYVPDEGFGVRLEDDVVIQINGDPINLMEDIPIETGHIEELMNELDSSFFRIFISFIRSSITSTSVPS